MATAIHILRAGRHTTVNGEALEFSEADLAATAAAYDPAKHEAPLVIGHPKLDAPAHGWVSSLQASGTDLNALPGQVNAEFAEGVRRGDYKKVSAAFYRPDDPNNPAKGEGVWYLRHVGFLGAAPPAIKGLRQVEFADDGADLVEIEFAEGDDRSSLTRILTGVEQLLRRAGVLPADSPAPAFAEPAPDPNTETTDMDPAELERRAAEITERENKLKADEAAFAERESRISAAEARAARSEDAEFVEGLVEKGQVLPAQKNRVIEVLHSLRGSEGAVEFAEGDATVKATAHEAFKDLLAGMPNLVEFAELSAPGDDSVTGGDFTTPDRAPVDQQQLAIHNKAVAFAEKNDVPYEVAVQRVGG